MSRVHDALRKAAQETSAPAKPPVRRSAMVAASEPTPAAPLPQRATPPGPVESSAVAGDEPPPAGVFIDLADLDDLESVIQNAREIPYDPLPDALLVNPLKPREAPAEEFRTLRTRLNHLQTLQPLHTLVVTSASPAEGKSFTATNLAVTQSQLADKRVLLADFDFRRPTVDKTFQIDCSPGITITCKAKPA
jgi:hypothetical protein